jgi:hypothetical protein
MDMKSLVKWAAIIRLTSAMRGAEHHVTVPAHKELRVGTLVKILSEGAEYLQVAREELERSLFWAAKELTKL